MSTPQWELVTKNKKDKVVNGTYKKLSKTEKKKFVENAPKVEDLLPLSQVKTLYSEFSDIKKPNADLKSKSKENDAKKQQQKKAQQQQQPKGGEKSKEKEKDNKESKPKTLDAALNRVNVTEFQAMVTSVQAKFDRTPLLWLRTIDNYLDSIINVEISDPTFSSKNHEYPLCLMPSALRSALQEALGLAGESNLQTYFEILLTNLAQEMTKGSHAVGTRLLLQFIATSYPKIAVEAVPKCLSLQNSYKNRKPIWLSILWAMGQAGFRDLSVGLKVWQEVMLPVLELRNYSQFVLEYLTRLLGRHAAGPALSVNEYLTALDAILRPNAPVSNQVTDALYRQSRVLRKIAVNATPDAKLNLFFKPLMERLSLADTDAYKQEILEFLFLCVCEDEQSFSTWKQLYSTHILESAALLQHIESKWNASKAKLAKKSFKVFIDFTVKTNASLQDSKPKIRGLEDCRKICQSISAKMAVKKSSYLSLITFLVLLMVGGAVLYDVKLHGSFKASSTGRVLEDIGALHYGNIALEQAKIYTQKGVVWTRENAPIYYATAVDVSKPYLELLRDLGYIGYNGLVKVLIKFDGWCSTTAPEFTSQVKEYAAIAGDTTKQYAIDFAHYTKVGFVSAQDYAAKNIFIGKWSPENLQKMTHEAVNVTQQYVLSTYEWIVQQVESGNKVR
ncbi:hypothetical protein FOCC_FOCC005203 [Frankliniella occidentalis]|uniref:Transmembrane protein 214-A isoform X1 n=1 Tax=Frankliniella occidentalis TaxID=133901 RepID=A0A6J1T7S7_FRAOC|nr:transmembrane protein 214-A isoform X1 [Frankliniella occidentalis]KAE8748008.1 hypothetical protein FOCC_FOCC005203 [Frankliniella occidentalis]